MTSVARPTAAVPALEVVDLHKTFGDVQVLNGVSLSVANGQIAAVIGPSGGGKSTLLRCINHLEQPDSGVIRINGDLLGHAPKEPGGGPEPSRKALYQQRARMPMVFQRFNLFPHLTAVENVALARVNVLKKPKAEAFATAREMLRRVGLQGKEQNYPSQLSGGQQQRVAIARALTMEPEIVLFDEPTSSLDPELVGGVLDVIENLASDGLTMIVVTHEMDFAQSTADWVYFMDGGRIREEGTADQVFRNPQHERTAAFIGGITAGRRKNGGTGSS